MCRFQRFTENDAPITCGQRQCPDRACQAKAAHKQAEILIRSFRDRLPTHCVVLKITDDEVTTSGQMAKSLRALTQYFRDFRKTTIPRKRVPRNRKSSKMLGGVHHDDSTPPPADKATPPTIEYDCRIEFDEWGLPHAHVTFIAPFGGSDAAMKKLIRKWWSASCDGRPVSVYCKPVKTAEGYARYVTKHLKDRSKVYLPPENWNGHKCRLIWQSRGFLRRPAKEIWAELVQEWYPPHAVTHEESGNGTATPEDINSPIAG